jgi:TPR repeat protein
MKYRISILLIILFPTEVLCASYIDLYFDKQYAILLSLVNEESALQNKEYNFVLGMMYGYGKGVESDTTEAEKYLKEANRLGHPEAMVELSVVLMTAFGETDQTMKKVIPSIIEAATTGNKRAQSKLAGFYFKGDWLEKDDKKAFHYASLSANQGYGYSMFYLGYFYEFGIGTAIDLDKSIHWYRKCSKSKYQRVKNACLEVLEDTQWKEK